MKKVKVHLVKTWTGTEDGCGFGTEWAWCGRRDPSAFSGALEDAEKLVRICPDDLDGVCKTCVKAQALAQAWGKK